MTGLAKELMDIVDLSEVKDSTGLYGVTIRVDRMDEWHPRFSARVDRVANNLILYFKEAGLTLRWHKGPAYKMKWADQRYWVGAYRLTRKSKRTNPAIVYEVIKYNLHASGTIWFKKQEDRSAFILMFNDPEVVSVEAFNRD